MLPEIFNYIPEILTALLIIGVYYYTSENTQDI
jgi:hypothetical protein